MKIAARAVTFDATGTLFHAPRLGEIYAEAFFRHGVPVEPGEIRRLISVVWQEFDCSRRSGEDRFAGHPQGARGWWGRFVERLCEHLGRPAPGPFLVAELFQRFSRGDSWEVYPEVRPTLADLRRRGLRLGVISNWDERLPGLLADLGLTPLVDAVVYSAACGVEKPDPRIFRHALDVLGTPAHLTVHVGDHALEDVEGALAAGMASLLLDRRGGGRDLADLSPLLTLLRPVMALAPR